MTAEQTTTATGATAPPLEMRGITKRYPGVTANDGIDLVVRAGEIHALLGENGAGKTTLMNVLYGLAVPDAGEIRLHGEPVTILSPHDAIDRGISMVHQHFMLVPVLSVAENILLGEEPIKRRIFLDRSGARERIRELGARFGWEIDPDRKVGQLSVGWQQRVEILKALYRNAKVLILDEPTAVLTPQETREIFDVLRRLRDEGYAIVFISHKLYEVLEVADRITVIRRGKVVGERIPGRDERGRPGRADGRARGTAHGRSRNEPSRRSDPDRRGPPRARRPRRRGRPRRVLHHACRRDLRDRRGGAAMVRTSWSRP